MSISSQQARQVKGDGASSGAVSYSVDDSDDSSSVRLALIMLLHIAWSALKDARLSTSVL
jgi:hypothetical protein